MMPGETPLDFLPSCPDLRPLHDLARMASPQVIPLADGTFRLQFHSWTGGMELPTPQACDRIVTAEDLGPTIRTIVLERLEGFLRWREPQRTRIDIKPAPVQTTTDLRGLFAAMTKGARI